MASISSSSSSSTPYVDSFANLPKESSFSKGALSTPEEELLDLLKRVGFGADEIDCITLKKNIFTLLTANLARIGEEKLEKILLKCTDLSKLLSEPNLIARIDRYTKVLLSEFTNLEQDEFNAKELSAKFRTFFDSSVSSTRSPLQTLTDQSEEIRRLMSPERFTKEEQDLIVQQPRYFNFFRHLLVTKRNDEFRGILDKCMNLNSLLSKFPQLNQSKINVVLSEMEKSLEKSERVESFIGTDIALVLEATDDYNNAFKGPLTPSKYPLCYKKVSCIGQCNETIDKLVSQGNRIRECWIRAHGCPTHFDLGKDGKDHIVDKDNIQSLALGLRKLEVGSDIILYSCNTGSETSDKSPNIGSLLSFLTHSRVHCPPLTSFGIANREPLTGLSVWYGSTGSSEDVPANVYEKGVRTY